MTTTAAQPAIFSDKHLSISSINTFKRCPRAYQHRYELGLKRKSSSDALRFGKTFHIGLEHRNNGIDINDAVATALADYETCPAGQDKTQWEVERQKVIALLNGYDWRYSEDNIQIIAAELPFEMPLINPETGRASQTWTIAGVIDAIAQLPDGRVVVLEYKTTAESIDFDSKYWLKLRCDPQISQYIIAARAIGYDVSAVYYDVTRRPTIRLKQKESPVEYGARLITDIGDRPDYYFQRREVPRLDDELMEYQTELWQQGRAIAEARTHGRWYRNVGRWTCDTCDYQEICLQNLKVTPQNVPAGFEMKS